MGYLKAKVVGGGIVEFADEPIGIGGKKVAFLTRDKQEVICFYFRHISDYVEQRRRIESIIGNYNVTKRDNGAYWKSHYCWPITWIDGDPSLPKAFLMLHNIIDPPLAVVMPAYRANFFFTDIHGIARIKDGRIFTSERPRKLLPPDEKGTFLNYLQVCTKISRAVRHLHFCGLAHANITSRSVLIDPKNGDACLIDIDSLSVHGIAPPSVLGTPGYIAPEVLAKQGRPHIEADRHALAVLIYELLLQRHPLCGPKINSPDSPEEDSLLSMGAKALFIEHPQDKSNAPQSAPVVPLNRLGPYLADLFQKAFVDGLHRPSRRPTAYDWEQGLYRTFNLLHPSPDKADWFVLAPSMPLDCPFTRKSLTEPVPFAHFYSKGSAGQYVDEGYGLTIHHRLPLMNWHKLARIIPSENSIHESKGYFTFNRGRWYLTNESDEPMQTLAGEKIAKGGSIVIESGLELRVSGEKNGRLFRFVFIPPTSLPSTAEILESRAIGIDFGTHKTLVARWDEEIGRPVLVRLRPGSGDEMPTVVYLNAEGTFCFGDEAEDMEVQDAAGYARAFKRDLGAGIAPYLLQAGEYSAAQLAEQYLQWLKERVETESLHGTVGHAVVTVPATFSPAARRELKDAARLAGFTKLELLDEPAAAGYAFLRTREHLWKADNLLVFDWGAGTLDLAIVRLVEGQPQVIPDLVGGKLHLGGEDIDRHLMQMVNRKLMELKLAKLECREPEEVNRVRRKLVQWKIRHGSKPDGLWRLTELTGVPTGTPLQWTSREIEQRIEEKVAEAMESVRELVKKAAATIPTQILSGVLLIGGTSQLPSVRTALEKEFPTLKVLPWDQRIAAVALGAAWKASEHDSSLAH